MIRRFRIEDLVTQDASGAVFRGVDTETAQTVAMRRFFPFGANGGGLNEDEQAAYAIALNQLVGIRHPALRTVIGGGCDPVDGIPFIVTEWIEGTCLQTYVERGPIAPAQAREFIAKALEVSELLSQALTREAVWVETDLRTVIIAAEETGRGVTFGICPLKWLGKTVGQGGLESIVALTEDLMGWGGRTIAGHAGNGLGAWLQWLRDGARKASLGEAREKFVASVTTGVPAPVPARPTARLAGSPIKAIRRKKKKSSAIPFLIGSGALAAIACGGWALVRWNDSKQQDAPFARVEKSTTAKISQAGPVSQNALSSKPALAAVIDSTPGESRAERATRRLAELTLIAEKDAAASNAKATQLALEIAKRGGIFSPADHDLLAVQKGKEVTVEGTFESIDYSSTKKTMYLQFSNNPVANEIRGAVRVGSGLEGLTEPKLVPLRGKRIHIRGKVKLELSGRLVITIHNRAAIEEVP